ncbi:hypothetical protein BV20DRAFT_854121 [Pilatotrama ljubarskyi]|nr:hypothetical protein BV20DRAFT_854121 [Pilatotrama ljubarskyi]
MDVDRRHPSTRATPARTQAGAFPRWTLRLRPWRTPHRPSIWRVFTGPARMTRPNRPKTLGKSVLVTPRLRCAHHNRRRFASHNTTVSCAASAHAVVKLRPNIPRDSRGSRGSAAACSLTSSLLRTSSYTGRLSANARPCAWDARSIHGSMHIPRVSHTHDGKHVDELGHASVRTRVLSCCTLSIGPRQAGVSCSARTSARVAGLLAAACRPGMCGLLVRARRGHACALAGRRGYLIGVRIREEVLELESEECCQCLRGPSSGYPVWDRHSGRTPVNTRLATDAAYDSAPATAGLRAIAGAPVIARAAGFAAYRLSMRASGLARAAIWSHLG